MTTDVKKYAIHASPKEGIHEGLIGIPTNAGVVSGSRPVVKVVHGKRSIHAVGLVLDSNFVRDYNSSKNRLPIVNPASSLVLNAWYRNRLGIAKPEGRTASVALELHEASGLWGTLQAKLDHPKESVRWGTKASLAGVPLSVLTFFLKTYWTPLMYAFGL